MKVAANYLLVQNKAELNIRNIIYHLHFYTLETLEHEGYSKLFTLIFSTTGGHDGPNWMKYEVCW